MARTTLKSEKPSGNTSATSTQIRVDAPSLKAKIRQQRLGSSESFGPWARVGFAACVAFLGVVLAATVFRPPRLEEHEQYEEALRVLRNDGMQATDANIRFALRLIDSATKPYSDRYFSIVNTHEWPPQCHQEGGICRDRPGKTVQQQDIDGHNMTIVELDTDKARVWLVENFLSQDETTELFSKAKTFNFSSSLTQHHLGNDWRSSSSAFARREDPNFQVVLRRAAALCKVPLTFMEAPQVVRYRPGERYQPHMDSDGPAHRHWTLLLYLNDPSNGGETNFPLLGMKVMPTPGAALMWENLRKENGQTVRNYYTLHDGQAPKGNEAKFAVNLWVRNSEFTPDL